MTEHTTHTHTHTRDNIKLFVMDIKLCYFPLIRPQSLGSIPCSSSCAHKALSLGHVGTPPGLKAIPDYN